MKSTNYTIESTHISQLEAGGEIQDEIFFRICEKNAAWSQMCNRMREVDYKDA